jgi:hypothetical protein
MLEMERQRGGGKYRNRLRLRGIKKDNSVRLEWVGISWTGKNAGGKLFDKKVHITRPANSFGYTLTKLFKFAHEWEKHLVEVTESKLVGIRQELHHLTRAVISISHAQNAETKRRTELDLTYTDGGTWV